MLGMEPSAMDGESVLQQQPLPVLSESPSGSQLHQDQQDPARDQADEQVERQVRAAIAELLPGVDLQTLSLYDFRCSVSRHLGWGRRGLEARAQRVSDWIKEAVEAHVAKSQQSPQQLFNAVLQDLGDEDSSKKLRVHMLTFSRLLPATIEAGDLRNVSEMSREAVADCVWKAFDNPIQGPGRPCSRAQGLVTKLVVFREFHQDGDYHFHVAVLLRQPLRRRPCAKGTDWQHTSRARTRSSGVQFATASFQLLPSQLWTMRPFHGVRLVAGVHSTSLPSHSGLGRQACGRNRCFGGK